MFQPIKKKIKNKTREAVLKPAFIAEDKLELLIFHCTHEV
jgi:hypothetical protein